MRAVAYGAKSTVDEKGSIPDQLADARKLAAECGLAIVREFQDEDASAYHGDRGPGLAEAMGECERMSTEDGACALIVQHSDRLARGDAKQARHLIEIVLWALKHDVELLSVQDPEILAGGDMALLLGAIGGMRNHQDSKRKGAAVKGGIRRRAVERRQYVGGRRPFGYRRRDRDPNTGRPTGPLVIDEAEAIIIRRIFAEYLGGRAQNAIARDLTREGVPTLTPTGSWYATTVRGMLENPLYKGWIMYGGESFPAVGPDGKPTLEPIIEAATWERARELREARSARGRPRGRRTVGPHLLTEGLLRCTCGAAMSTRTNRDTRAANGHGYETYVCVKRLHHGPSACAQKPMKRAMIDGAIYDYFETVALDIDSTRSIVAGQAAHSLAENTVLRRQAEREGAKAEDALARIEGDYIDGKIDAEKWTRLETRLRGERDGARAQIEQLDRKGATIEAQMAAIDAEAVVVQEMAALRQLVTGEIRQGKDGDLDQLRASLRRLFVGFELASPTVPFGSGVLTGQGCVPSDDSEFLLAFDSGYYLIPYLRRQAIDHQRDDPAGFPAVQRLGLDLLHSNLCNLLAAW